MKKIICSFLCLFVLFSFGVCAASPVDSNATAAVALYIDTSGHYVPGMDILNKALNEVIRFKVNALLLGSEVQSGNEVLRDLSRCNISSGSDATAEALAAYGSMRHVNNIILLSVRPLDVAIDLKLYSAVNNSFIVDKTITRPDGTEALSTVEALSNMVGDEVDQALQLVKKTVATLEAAQS
ncbi:hypothetical protein SATMO3_52990 [Sporomusa aerivorans]